MAIISTTVNRLLAASDLFDSFHGAHDAFSELKEKKYPEDTIFQFVQLTGNDDLEARAAVLKDLGFTSARIEILDGLLAEGKILICVDSLDEVKCERVGRILAHAGGLDLEEYFSRARVPEKKPAPKRKKASAAKKSKRPASDKAISPS